MRRPPKLTRWKPKKWRHEYERMVYMSVVGFGNKAIGETLGYTKEHVSNILNLDEADKLRELLLERMREKAIVDIPTTLSRIAEKTAERLLAVVTDDKMFEKSPFAVIDRGLDVMKGLGHLRGGGNGSPQYPVIAVGGNAMIGMPQEVAAQLAEGLKVANQAKQLNADAEFTTKRLGQGSGSSN